MAHTRRFGVRDYPYSGTFYEQGTEDYTKPLYERDITDVQVWTTACDIQEVSKSANPVLTATFSVFMPFPDVSQSIPIRRGLKFVGNMGTIDVSGIVTNVVLSQLGGLVAYVKDYDAEQSI